MSFNSKKAILLIFFNKTEETKRTFNLIRQYQPYQIFLACDGSCHNDMNEEMLIKDLRTWILDNIDWTCEVKTLFQNNNLGCGLAPATAISWFFEHVEEGIILEDDCVPHPDFFTYCSALLERFRYDERIAVIGGDNFNANKKYGQASYYFSNYSYTWGWATWRRVWVNYQFDLNKLDANKMYSRIEKTFKSEEEKKFWKDTFNERLLKNYQDAWDYQLWFHVWYHNMISIVPNVNLVKNIGFNENATHTTDSNSDQGFLETFPIMPLTHPGKIKIQHRADSIYFRKYWSPTNSSYKSRLVALIYRFTPHTVIELYRKIKRSFQ